MQVLAVLGPFWSSTPSGTTAATPYMQSQMIMIQEPRRVLGKGVSQNPASGQNHRRKVQPKKSTQTKSSSEQVLLHNFRWVPDLCHREEGKSSRELFKKVRVSGMFFGHFGILGGFSGLCKQMPRGNQTRTNLRATISRRLSRPTSWWGKTVASDWRSCKRPFLRREEGGNGNTQKGT